MIRLGLVIVLVAPVSLFMAWAIGWWAAPLVIPYGLYMGWLVYLLPAPRR